ncbi:MAG: hypothetical protein ABI553_10895 [Chloroflexota bacterium]
MNHVIDLDRALTAYFDTEATDGAPAGLLDHILERTAARRPYQTWSARLRQRNQPRPFVLEVPARAILVGLLIVALIAAAAFVGGRLTMGPPMPAPSHPPSTPPPSAAPAATLALGSGLDGTWSADQPATLRFTEPSGPKTLTLALGPRTTIGNSMGRIDWLDSDARMVGGVIELTARVTGSGPGLVDEQTVSRGAETPDPGNIHPPCTAGAVGRYEPAFSSGPWMTFISTEDACAARLSVLSNRVWWRRTPLDGGQSTVVDAFAPKFSLTLPPGSFTTSRSAASWRADAVDGSVSMQAWLDPQGVRDGCDARGGLARVAPSLAAFLTYLRTRSDLEVVSSEASTVDGLAAMSIVVRAATVDACGLYLRYMTWQGLTETSGEVASLVPGSVVRLVIVEVGSSTVLLQFEPSDAADSIVASIRIGQ